MKPEEQLEAFVIIAQHELKLETNGNHFLETLHKQDFCQCVSTNVITLLSHFGLQVRNQTPTFTIYLQFKRLSISFLI